MNRLAIIFVLGLLTGTAHGTFELEDPPAQVYEELEAMADRQAEQKLVMDALCVINEDTH